MPGRKRSTAASSRQRRARRRRQFEAARVQAAADEALVMLTRQRIADVADAAHRPARRPQADLPPRLVSGGLPETKR